MKGLTDFMKKNWQGVAMIVLLAAGALAFRGCNEEQQQDFRKGVKIGAAAAVEVEAQVNDLCRAELIKPESCEKAQPHTKRIAELAQRVDKFLEAHPKLSPENKQELFSLVDDLLKAIDALEGDGIIEFNDPENRRKFLLYVALAKSGIRIARASIEAAPVVEPGPSPSL